MTFYAGAREALALLTGPAAERLSVSHGCAALVIDDDDGSVGSGPIPAPPCVTIVVAPTTSSALAAWADVVVPDRDQAAVVEAAVLAHPQASVALVQLLRVTEHLPVSDALTAESWAYGLLQSGPEFAHWLAGNRRPPRIDREPAVCTELDGDRTIVVLNRPHVRNALNTAMRDELCEVLRALAETTGPIELRGAGTGFCAGGDLGDFGTTADPVTGHLVRSTRSVPRALAALASRVTASVHGECIGAGVELAAFADRVLAAPGTSFRLPEVGMGLLPGCGGTVSLPRRIGRQRTAWLALTGRPIDVDTARRWGLVDGITPA